eukprot:6191065-Pleurochrysis_carterae.AAC.2
MHTAVRAHRYATTTATTTITTTELERAEHHPARRGDVQRGKRMRLPLRCSRRRRRCPIAAPRRAGARRFGAVRSQPLLSRLTRGARCRQHAEPPKGLCTPTPKKRAAGRSRVQVSESGVRSEQRRAAGSN